MKQQLHKTNQPNRTSPFSQFELLSMLLFVLFSANLSAQSTDQNYIKTTTYKVPTTTSITNTNSPEIAVEITYIDGLGRPKQKIAHNQSGNGDDLVTHISYDGFGRQPKEFLPYERSSSLVFDTDGEGSTTTYYTTDAPSHTSNPYSEKIFENSPLNRVLEQAAPGDPWAMANDHTVKFSYETNTASEVYQFSVILGGDDPQLHYKGKYPEGQLRKNVVKDENWRPSDGRKGTTIQYTDKMGRMVLKRTFDVPIGENHNSTGTITLDTYYVYDVYGNLSFVLPPKLSDQIISGGSLVGNHQALLDALGYQYTYDYRNRLIHKKIPGKHREFMVYDMLDRLIATGPTLSPFGDGQEGWLHTKYDMLDRVVYTFWQQGLATSQAQMNMANQLPTYLSEVRISGTNTVNGVAFNYTN